MADEKRKKPVIYNTPVGVLGRFPKLKEPDDYKEKLNFKCELILSGDEAAKIIERIDALLPEAQAAFKESKDKAVAEGRKKGKAPKVNEETHLPYYPVIDEDGNETGKVAVKFKSAAEYEDKKTGEKKRRQVAHFTASGKSIPHAEKPELWGGSQVRIAYTMGAFGNTAAGTGVSLRLEAVKIIQAVAKGSGDSAERYGFSDEEDGYEGEPGSGTETGLGQDESGDGAEDGDEPAPAF